MLKRSSSLERVSSAYRMMSSPSLFAGQKPYDAARAEQPALDDAAEQLLRVLVQLGRGGAVLRVLQNRRKRSLQLPRREEERPVDVLRDVGERLVVQEPPAGE